MGAAVLITLIYTSVVAKIAHGDWQSPDVRIVCACATSACISLFALVAMRERGRILARLLPRWGDLSMGTVSALVLVIVTWAGRTLLAPQGTPRQAWLVQVYYLLGDTWRIQENAALPWLVTLSSMLDEVVWRGWIQDGLGDLMPQWRAWLLTAGLYGLHATPTVFALQDPVEGLNPLILALALAGGLLWGYLTYATGRATAALLAHAGFTYFMVVQFRPAL
jgi:membrane protease YdiL (CAAX protease family)